jgi:hypothetical protein
VTRKLDGGALFSPDGVKASGSLPYLGRERWEVLDAAELTRQQQVPW